MASSKVNDRVVRNPLSEQRASEGSEAVFAGAF